MKKCGEIEVSLLTFEDNVAELQSDRVAEIRSELKAKGIEWHWLRYHKRPSALATAYDVFRGAWFIRQKIARDEIDILHGRVHIPTLMGAIARRFSRRRPKLLFDIRGFFPEEYTDAGIWPENGLLYRSAKRVERWLMKESDGFVVLTEKAREILFPDAVPQPDGGWLTGIADLDETKIRNSKFEIRNLSRSSCRGDPVLRGPQKVRDGDGRIA